MGKRSNFERIPKDLYRTFDPRAVRPLLPYLKPGTRYVEPCAGHGDLIGQLDAAGHHCVAAYDVEQHILRCQERDALTLDRCEGDCFVTNPPWSRPLLHALIAHLSSLAPTWLLFDADWMHIQKSRPFMLYCHVIVSVGRCRWIPGTTDDGKDNAAWYLFDRTRQRMTAGPVFLGRAA